MALSSSTQELLRATLCTQSLRAWHGEAAITVDDDLTSVVNDPLRLRQMVLNLAGNAVKFSKPGGRVLLRAQGLNAEQWCVEVEDRGIGIDDEGIQQLFGRFVQLSAGSTKHYGGTGLGLALVRMIARAQGGDVQVRSKACVGSTFTLVLPRVLRQGSHVQSAGLS